MDYIGVGVEAIQGKDREEAESGVLRWERQCRQGRRTTVENEKRVTMFLSPDRWRCTLVVSVRSGVVVVGGNNNNNNAPSPCSSSTSLILRHQFERVGAAFFVWRSRSALVVLAIFAMLWPMWSTHDCRECFHIHSPSVRLAATKEASRYTAGFSKGNLTSSSKSKGRGQLERAKG